MKTSAYLTSLGSTSEEVAASLRAQGVKGIPGDSCRCAIAVAVRAKCSGFAKWAKVTARGVTFDDPQVIDPPTPEAVRQFIKDFDGRKYIDLIGSPRA